MSLQFKDKNPEKKNEPVGLYRSARDKLNKVMQRTGDTNATRIASIMIEYAYDHIEWVEEETDA